MRKFLILVALICSCGQAPEPQPMAGAMVGGWADSAISYSGDFIGLMSDTKFFFDEELMIDYSVTQLVSAQMTVLYDRDTALLRLSYEGCESPVLSTTPKENELLMLNAENCAITSENGFAIYSRGGVFVYANDRNELWIEINGNFSWNPVEGESEQFSYLLRFHGYRY